MDIEKAIKSTKKIKLHNKTVINLMYTSRHVEQEMAKLKDHDISMQQYNVLRILRGQKGNPANLSTIQERMIDKSSNTTRLVDKLILKDLAKRQTCEQNRRKVEIFITPNGLKLLETLDPIIEEQNKETTRNLTVSEMKTLNQLLDKLRNEEE